MTRLFTFLLIFLLTVSISGCGSKSTTSQEKKSENPTTSTPSEADMKKAGEDLDKALEALSVKGWPKDRLPKDLPEYTEGSIVNSGGSNTEFYLKIEKSDKDALNRYLEKLKSLNWNIFNEDRDPGAKKGIYSIEFTWQVGGSMLQMVVNTSEVGKWPKAVLPPEIIPPENCTFVGDMSITVLEENQSWYFNYECQGIDAEAAKTYMKKLQDNGWSGDDSMIFKDFEWKGQKYSSSIEIYETVGDTTTFTCNYNISN